MLACELEHPGIDLADLLAPAGVLGGQRPRQRACAAADMHDATCTGRPQHDPDPPHVVELKVGGVGEIDVGGVHVALAQKPPRRSERIALGDKIARPSERELLVAEPGHAA